MMMMWMMVLTMMIDDAMKRCRAINNMGPEVQNSELMLTFTKHFAEGRSTPKSFSPVVQTKARSLLSLLLAYRL